MLTSIHFDDETYSDEIKRRLMKSLPMADVALLRLTRLYANKAIIVSQVTSHFLL